MKFGKIDKKDLEMSVYEKDSSAAAVVLADYGFSEILYNREGGFYLQFTRHSRVKILSKDGYDKADIAVYLYHSGTDKESLLSLKGATYNLEGGKIVTGKLGKKSIYEEEYNKNWDEVKWTMPQVKEGSVIEYTYKIKSDFLFNFRDWEFQTDIPVIWSEYRAGIPEYFFYEKFMQGYHALSINDKMERSESITTTKYSTGNVTFVKNFYRWVAKDVPAFVEEPYMTSTSDYLSKINFELSTIHFPNERVRQIMGTWEDINNTFLTSHYFGVQVKGAGFLKKEVVPVIAGSNTDEEKIGAIVAYVKNKMSWDGRHRKYVTETLRSAFNKGKGSSADINLMLVNMLRKAGFKADPVLISTRSNGFVREQFALSSQFNYVIGLVELEDGKHLLLDATDKRLPLFLLPERCLNGRGWRVSETNAGWVSLKGSGIKRSVLSAKLDLIEDGSLRGTVNARYDSYAAYDMRKLIERKEDAYKGYVEKKWSWEIDSLEIKNQDSFNKSLNEHYAIQSKQNIESVGNLIYFNPFIAERIEENPFKIEKRDYPVDFTCPRKTMYVVSVTIPDGYEVDELPKGEVIALPEGAAKYSYYVSQSDKTINFRSQLDINKPLFGSPEYEYLKEFYTRIVAKQSEQIVLKKIN